MRKPTRSQPDPDLLDEYDFRQGIRGAYAQRFKKGSNVVVLSQEVAKVFPDSRAVNAALRALIKIASQQAKTQGR